MDSEADLEFARLAGEYLNDLAERHPDAATSLGDHRFDDRLPDLSAGALADERRGLDGWAARLDALDAGALSDEHRVDAAMMAGSVARRAFELDDLRELTWNPLLANPGRAIYQLLARDFAPLPDRLAALAGRLAGVPALLEAARRLLGPMPRVHLETALGQFGGTITMVSKQVDAALEAAPECRPAAGAGPARRPGGADRAPRVAGRPAGGGGARAGRRQEPQDRAGPVRPQAVADAQRGRRRGRHPQPGRGPTWIWSASRSPNWQARWQAARAPGPSARSSTGWRRTCPTTRPSSASAGTRWPPRSAS